MRWLYLYFPSLQLDQLAVQYPAQPMALACPKRHQLLGVNSLAAAAGVKVGQSVATAVLLCRELQLFSPEPARVKQLLQQLAERLYQVTADLALQPPDALLIRVSSMLKLYPDPARYWQQLQLQLADCPYQYLAAAGQTPLAAKLLARSGQTELYLTPAAEQAKLALCPLTASDLPAASIEQLARLGIRQLGPLLALPAAELARRFSQDVLQYLAALTGRVLQLPQFYRPRLQFNRELQLHYEITESPQLLKPLQPLLQQLQQFLRRANLLCQRLQLTLQFRQHSPLPLQIRARAGEACAANWQQLVSLHLAQLQLPEPVYALQLAATDYVPDQRASCNLLAQRSQPLSKAQLLSVLVARLGEQAVVTPTLNLSHWPEAESSASAVAALPALNAALCYQLRPILQLPKALPLTEAVTLLSGAERLEQLCWQSGTLLQRDYYLARTEQGQLWWVYRTPQQQWYLQGWFS